MKKFILAVLVFMLLPLSAFAQGGWSSSPYDIPHGLSPLDSLRQTGDWSHAYPYRQTQRPYPEWTGRKGNRDIVPEINIGDRLKIYSERSVVVKNLKPVSKEYTRLLVERRLNGDANLIPMPATATYSFGENCHIPNQSTARVAGVKDGQILMRFIKSAYSPNYGCPEGTLFFLSEKEFFKIGQESEHEAVRLREAREDEVREKALIRELLSQK